MKKLLLTLSILLLAAGPCFADSWFFAGGAGGPPPAPDPTINNVQTNSGSSVSSLTEASYVVGSYTNGILFVCAGGEETGDGIPSSATFNGSAMTALNSSTVGTTIDASSRIFYMLNPPATTADIVVTYSTTMDNVMLTALVVDNLEQTGPTNETTTNQLTGTTSPISSTITATPTDAFIIDCITNGNTSNFTVTGTGHTEQAEVDGASSTTSTGAILKVAGSASSSEPITWTVATVNRWAQTAAVFEKYSP